MSRQGLALYCPFGTLAYLLSGCLNLPSLSFPDTAEAEAGSTDAADARAISREAGCPDLPPPGATACCGSVPCAGDCDAHCSECENKCPSMGSVCCAKATAVCHQAGFVCP